MGKSVLIFVSSIGIIMCSVIHQKHHNDKTPQVYSNVLELKKLFLNGDDSSLDPSLNPSETNSVTETDSVTDTSSVTDTYSVTDTGSIIEPAGVRTGSVGDGCEPRTRKPYVPTCEPRTRKPPQTEPPCCVEESSQCCRKHKFLKALKV